MYYVDNFVVINLLPRKEQNCTNWFDNYHSTVWWKQRYNMVWNIICLAITNMKWLVKLTK